MVSGGLDSAVALFWAARHTRLLAGLTLLDAHGHPKELEGARRLCAFLGIEHHVAPMPFVRTAARLHREGYAAPRSQGTPDGYVPLRNLVFYSVAAYFAEAVGAQTVVGGHIATDPTRFPDAAPAYFQALEGVVSRSLFTPTPPLTFTLPLAGLDKEGVVRLGASLGVPFEWTWSCYEEGDAPCGGCPACHEREGALACLRAA
jgi:7-cyano-7-deazaguanine synthase